MSHGNRNGVSFLKDGNRQVDREICFEEFPKFFTHDKIPSLKGVPKSFISQTCRGSKMVSSGGGATEFSLQKTSSYVGQPWMAHSLTLMRTVDPGTLRDFCTTSRSLIRTTHSPRSSKKSPLTFRMQLLWKKKTKKGTVKRLNATVLFNGHQRLYSELLFSLLSWFFLFFLVTITCEMVF